MQTILFYGSGIRTMYDRNETIIEVPQEEAYKGENYMLFLTIVRNADGLHSNSNYEIYKMNDTKFKVYFSCSMQIEYNWLIIGERKTYF